MTERPESKEENTGRCACSRAATANCGAHFPKGDWEFPLKPSPCDTAPAPLHSQPEEERTGRKAWEQTSLEERVHMLGREPLRSVTSQKGAWMPANPQVLCSQCLTPHTAELCNLNAPRPPQPWAQMRSHQHLFS